LKGNDEIVVKVPNTLLDNQKVFNLSKGNTSQVMQKVYFSYNDIDKIPFLVSEIKAEIQASCSKLIPHPFRVHWSEYAENYLVVTVDARFDIKPTGDAYHDNKQKVLEAVARATKRCNVKFYSK
jgi:small-conductance mechanosensitive channel